MPLGGFRGTNLLERIVTISDKWPKPVAGLPIQVVNDKRRYRQHRAMSHTSQATTASKSLALASALRV